MSSPRSQHYPEGSVTCFFQQMRTGDSLAVHHLWTRYFPRIVALARRTLGSRVLGFADGEDAAQSAFASFCLRVREGKFQIQDRDDLWKLLGVMTVNKARMQARKEQAGKRGGGKVLHEAALHQPDGSPLTLDELGQQLPTSDFDFHSEELLKQLEPDLRTFALLRLLGHSNLEIAEIQECTLRKVERKLNLIRLRWQSEWGTTE